MMSKATAKLVVAAGRFFVSDNNDGEEHKSFDDAVKKAKDAILDDGVEQTIWKCVAIVRNGPPIVEHVK